MPTVVLELSEGTPTPTGIALTIAGFSERAK